MRSGVVSGSGFNSRNTLDTIILQRKLPRRTIGDPVRSCSPGHITAADH